MTEYDAATPVASAASAATPWPGLPLAVTDEVVARSANALWVVRPATYCRLPVNEHPRQPPTAIDRTLDDMVWHDHIAVYLIDHVDDIRLRTIPAGRPAGAFVIVTGALEIVRGSDRIADAQRQQRADSPETDNRP